ncbi:phosphoribosyltransferase [Kineococcus sp. SYSU DK003]|uniref:phosphoribosyltransferase n=1 Tax=Kineococcus sp. SYSU DK003 TaxID=3383124 RepID=UPI003D7D6967
MSRPPYAHRAEAGRELGRLLAPDRRADDTVVLGLPRGGVPVAAEVASALHVPLDVLVVRKLGLPGHEELAMGAVAGVGGELEVVRNEDVLRSHAVPEAEFDAVRRRESEQVRDREQRWRGERPPLDLAGRTVLLVDDGLATGATLRAAVAAVRHRRPGRVVVAAPVGSAQACTLLGRTADAVVCPWRPRPFTAVGQAYADFSPTSDAEVGRLLATG